MYFQPVSEQQVLNNKLMQQQVNKLGAVGCAHLFNALAQNTSLKYLGLNNNGIGSLQSPSFNFSSVVTLLS